MSFREFACSESNRNRLYVCRPVGEALAAELAAFSLDVVGIVAAYLVCVPATAGAKAQLLCSFGSDVLRGECFGIATSPDCSRIWVSDCQTLAVFDADGKHLSTVKSNTHGVMEGVVFDSDGRAFVVSQSRGCVLVCDQDGSVQRTIGSYGRGNGLLNHPRRIALHGELLFVANTGNNRISMFNKATGAFVRSCGGYGDGDGQFQNPVGVAVSAAGEVFVGDYALHRVQVNAHLSSFLRATSVSSQVRKQRQRPWTIQSSKWYCARPRWQSARVRHVQSPPASADTAGLVHHRVCNRGTQEPLERVR